MDQASGISVRGAAMSYGGIAVFRDLDLDLPGGEWTCLLGTSGVGKSSLLRYIAGLPGEASLTGRIDAEDGVPLAGRIAYMAQNDLLFPWATVLDNVLIGYRLRGGSRRMLGNGLKDRARALLDRVGLSGREDDLPGALSGGMRQRAALARTLMEDRPVVLMDEPFSALDALTRYRTQDLAAELLARRTVLLVTHDPLEALRIGDRVCVMSGTPARLEPDALAPPGAKPRAVDTPDLVRLHGDLLSRLGIGKAAA